MNFTKKYLKQEIKNLVNKIFPKSFLLYLMEKIILTLVLKPQMHVMQTVHFVLTSL